MKVRPKKTNPLSGLKELTPIDIRKCKKLSELMAGLKNCAFGANMIGSVVETFDGWTTSAPTEHLPVVVYDGHNDGPFWALLMRMVTERMVDRVLTSQEFADFKAAMPHSDRNVLVIGPYMVRYADSLHNHPSQRTLYVNTQRQCGPGMARDGSFTNVCFSDPGVVIPIMYQVVKERRGEAPVDPVAFLQSLAKYSGVGKATAMAAEVAHKMFTARDCRVMLTLSGAMTAAQLGGIVRVMMEDKMVHGIVATGALMAHGLVEGLGLRHLMHDPSIPDHVLVRAGMNRITTVIEPETNFDVIDQVVGAVLSKISGKKPIAPSQLLRKIGLYLNRTYPQNKSILGTAAKMNIPVFVPAFFDSELGNDVTVTNRLRRKQGLPPVIIDQEADNQNLIKHSLGAKKLGIFTVGGGVPRNWAQNLGPLVNLHNNRAGTKYPSCKYAYAVRIDPAQMDLGHLSGCTYDEGTSWGKFIRKLMKAEVANDATVIWPLIVWAELSRKRPANDQGGARKHRRAA